MRAGTSVGKVVGSRDEASDHDHMRGARPAGVGGNARHTPESGTGREAANSMARGINKVVVELGSLATCMHAWVRDLEDLAGPDRGAAAEAHGRVVPVVGSEFNRLAQPQQPFDSCRRMESRTCTASLNSWTQCCLIVPCICM